MTRISLVLLTIILITSMILLACSSFGSPSKEDVNKVVQNLPYFGPWSYSCAVQSLEVIQIGNPTTYPATALRGERKIWPTKVKAVCRGGRIQYGEYGIYKNAYGDWDVDYAVPLP